MLTINRRPGPVLDCRTAVLIDLPHAADKPADPQLVSLVAADTHEPIPNVLGFSLHFDINARPGIWAVAEQFVDEQGEPKSASAGVRPDYHPEYFGGALPTALFRYEVAGFTTGSRFDQASTWHLYVSDAAMAESVSEIKPTGLTEFEVTLSNLFKTHVTGRHFEYADGFVAFYDAEGRRSAAFRTEEVLSVRTLTEKRVLVVDDAQLRILRSALLWDEQRIADTETAADYRALLRDVLTRVLGMFLPEQQAANECAEHGEASCDQLQELCEPDGPNERARNAAGQLDELAERR